MSWSKQKEIIMIMYARSVGGAELQFLELANYLANNHRVRLLCLGGDRAIRDASISNELDVVVYPYNSTFGVLWSLGKAVIQNAKLADSIITTSFFGNLLGFLIGVFSNAKLTSLQTVSVCMRHPTVDRFVLREFDTLIAGANDIKDYLVEYGQNPGKIHVVHNWVDFSKRKVTQKPLDMKVELGIEGKTAIGCIGRFHPQKGQIYLIRAFAEIFKSYPNSVLILVGDGETKELLEKEVKKLGITSQVIFTGTISGDEYNNLLNMFDLYVQPSVFEGLPRTLLDAMYMGKAIVATSINGNKEAIKHEKNGLLVSSKNDELIFESISRLVSNKDWANNLAQKAQQDAKSNFDMLTQLNKIEFLIYK